MAEAVSYTVREEIAHSVIHGAGTLGAVAGLVLLSLKTRGLLGAPAGSRLDNAAVVLFAAAMIGMFLVSTLYHAIQHEGAKDRLRVMDHSMIYLFIAGTYTPFCLIALKGGWGWSIFAVEWSMAALGVIFSFLQLKALKKIEVAVYIVMGWVILVGLIPLARSVPASSIVFLVSGGIAYTLGTIWYRKKNLRGSHSVWHSFVVLGAVCHWLSIWLFIR